MSEEKTTRIGDYEILGVLGKGGMGKVFKVRNVISDRIEAMKILLPDLSGRQDLADRFLREIKLLASLNHPNIAALRTALTLNNQLVMVMEYVEGVTLGERLEHGPIPVAEAVNYTEQVLAALSYAHSRNVIHRDIKPANMMLTPEGVVKLMDFGIARSAGDHGLTTTGTTIGSLYYMSPEQVKGQATDARSDLYSLGISLYEMVTGQRPFRADSDYSIMAAQVQQEPKPPVELRTDLPPALNQIILTAIAKDPAQRFQSADAFRNALSSLHASPAVAINQDGVSFKPSNSIAPGATAILLDAGPPVQTNLQAAPFETPISSEAVPSVLQMSAPHRTHRGLYMTLGAATVLAVLVIAGLYMPRKASIRANEQLQSPQEKPVDSSAPSPNSDNVPAVDKDKTPETPPRGNGQTQADADQSVHHAAQLPERKGNVSSRSAEDNTGTQLAGQTERISTSDVKKARKSQALKAEPQFDANANLITGQGRQSSQDAASGHADAIQLKDLEQQADLLSSRVSSINASLDNLRNQQSAQGYGLRSDIASAQELMKTHMARAQAALQKQDAVEATRYLDLAEGDAAKLDEFLGH